MNSETTSPRVAEHILGKSLQRLLRPDFDEYARAGVVQRVQALDELHGRSNLPRQNVQHLRHDAGSRGIELAVDVGDDRQARRFRCRRSSIRRSGSLAGATIEVWKAWLTGKGTAL